MKPSPTAEDVMTKVRSLPLPEQTCLLKQLAEHMEKTRWREWVWGYLPILVVARLLLTVPYGAHGTDCSMNCARWHTCRNSASIWRGSFVI